MEELLAEGENEFSKYAIKDGAVLHMSLEEKDIFVTFVIKFPTSSPAG